MIGPLSKIVFSGEQFRIELDSISHRVPSGQPLEVTQIIGKNNKTSVSSFSIVSHSAPAPVTEIQPVLDAENITLQWPRPDGRIDEYFIAWFPLDDPDDARAKNIPGDIETEGINRLVKVNFREAFIENPLGWI